MVAGPVAAGRSLGARGNRVRSSPLRRSARRAVAPHGVTALRSSPFRWMPVGCVGESRRGGASSRAGRRHRAVRRRSGSQRGRRLPPARWSAHPVAERRHAGAEGCGASGRAAALAARAGMPPVQFGGGRLVEPESAPASSLSRRRGTSSARDRSARNGGRAAPAPPLATVTVRRECRRQYGRPPCPPRKAGATGLRAPRLSMRFLPVMPNLWGGAGTTGSRHHVLAGNPRRSCSTWSSSSAARRSVRSPIRFAPASFTSPAESCHSPSRARARGTRSPSRASRPAGAAARARRRGRRRRRPRRTPSSSPRSGPASV